jgi:hypothetical protein
MLELSGMPQNGETENEVADEKASKASHSNPGGRLHFSNDNADGVKIDCHVSNIDI